MTKCIELLPEQAPPNRIPHQNVKRQMIGRDKRLLSTNAIIFAFQDACKKILHFINPFKKLLNLKITDI